MSLIVQKFGGTSVKDAERIFHVAGIIADTYRAGNDVIVVLSAQGCLLYTSISNRIGTSVEFLKKGGAL